MHSYQLSDNIKNWEKLKIIINKHVKSEDQLGFYYSEAAKRLQTNIPNAIEEKADYVSKQSFGPTIEAEIEPFKQGIIIYENKSSLELSELKLLWIQARNNLSRHPEGSLNEEIDRKIMLTINRIGLYNHLLSRGWRVIEAHEYHSILRFDEKTGKKKKH